MGFVALSIHEKNRDRLKAHKKEKSWNRIIEDMIDCYEAVNGASQ